MSRERECTKKDKRLLVLLAFGVLVLLLDYAPVFMPTERHPVQYWLEIRDEDPIMYCLPGPDELLSLRAKTNRGEVLPADHQAKNILAERMRRNRAAAVMRNPDGGLHPTALSPRLAFFLGRPMAINAATPTELSLLPGIGPGLAQNIVLSRDKNGRFDSRQDLLAVPGIGETRAEKLLLSITFEE